MVADLKRRRAEKDLQEELLSLRDQGLFGVTPPTSRFGNYPQATYQVMPQGVQVIAGWLGTMGLQCSLESGFWRVPSWPTVYSSYARTIKATSMLDQRRRREIGLSYWALKRTYHSLGLD
jgi:hypothetical protein